MGNDLDLDADWLDVNGAPNQKLTFSVESDNTVLLPNYQANINLGLHVTNYPHHYGAPGARSVKITPAAHQHGTAVITFKVSDGVNQAELAIDLTVRPVNDAPSFAVKTSLPDILGAVGNQSIKEDEGGTEVEQRVVGWATNLSAKNRKQKKKKQEKKK